MSSGIEKALEKSRRRGGRNMVVAPSGRELGSPGRRADLTRRIEARRALARMEEPELLDQAALEQRKIIHPEMMDTPTGNAIREIRTKIFKSVGEEGMVISVIPIVPESGASFVAWNLAAAIALDESRSALVVGFDFVTPEEGGSEADTVIGIGDYLEEESDEIQESDIIYPSGIRRVRHVPAGYSRSNMAEKLNSIKLQQFIHSVASRYDNRFVILDAPPLMESADSVILGEMSDACILVLPYGRLTKKQFADALDIIGRDSVFGVVLNDVPLVTPWFRSKPR